jgi:glycosyltransferase involved in cell wall biosynthesis
MKTALHIQLSVGNSPDRALFEAKAQNTSVTDCIHFEGFQPEPQRYLLPTDIFVLASYKDPSPLVIPEAREAGCAIIASDVDGIPESLDGGQVGILVHPGDSGTLAAALLELLSSTESWQLWRNRARHNLEWLNAQRVSEETLAVYSELLTDQEKHSVTAL